MLLIFIRVILSWIPQKAEKLQRFIYSITEPILGPIRKVVPPLGGMMDLSPIIAYLALFLIQEIMSRI